MGSPSAIITGGLGNGTFNGSPSLLLSLGFGSAANVKTFYLLDIVASGSFHYSLQDGGVPPTTATTDTGWIVGNEVDGWAQMEAGVIAVQNAFSAFPTQIVPPGFLSNSFRTGLLTGVFQAGEWTFSFPVIALTSGGDIIGRIDFRLFKSASQNGAGATDLFTLSGVVNGKTNEAIDLDTVLQQVLSETVELDEITFEDEYLFCVIIWEITDGPAGATSRDVLLRVGSDAFISTPEFGGLPFVCTAVLTHSGASFAAVMTTVQDYTGIATLTHSGALFASTGASFPPGFFGTVALVHSGATFSAAATMIPVPAVGTAALAHSGASLVSATLQYVPALVTSTATLAHSGATILSLALSSPPSFAGSASPELPSATFSSNIVTTLPVFTSTVALAHSGVVFASVGNFTFPAVYIDTICFELYVNDIQLEAEMFVC